LGWGASLFLVLSPRYYGHSFNNPKDIPFAVFYILSLLAIIRSSPFWDTSRLPLRITMFLGLSLGAIASIRLAGIFVSIYLILAFWIYQVRRLAIGKTTFSTCIASFKSHCIYPNLIALGMIIVCWPYAHIPFLGNRDIKLWDYLVNFKWSYTVLFEGRFISLENTPWYFLVKWFFITTPPVIIIGFLIFLILQIISPIIKNIRGNGGGKGSLFKNGLLLTSIVIPYIYSFFNNSILYGGIRHFLFFLPVISVLSAIGYYCLYGYVKNHWIFNKGNVRFLPLLFILLILIPFLPVLKWQIESHPNQYIYFNEIFGGAD